MGSNRCSICQKGGGSCICGGCKAFFCIKHLTEHRQKLSAEFNREVVRSHDELLKRINTFKPSTNSSADLFHQIDRWEAATVVKVNNAAERARHQLTQLIDRERETLIAHYETLTKEIRSREEEDDFVEDDIKQLQEKINQMQELLEQQPRPDKFKVIIVENNQIDWNRLIHVEKTQETLSRGVTDTSTNNTWLQNGITVAGGTGYGKGLNELYYPHGLHVDDDQTVYIADCYNHRIVEWKCGATSGQVVAGGNGQGNRSDQLYNPSDVIIDKQTDSLIICDRGNERVVRWPRRDGTSGQTIISDVCCSGLMMDNDGFLYVSDSGRNEVKRWRMSERRWRMGKTRGTVVAGANGPGNHLNQLNSPIYVFIDLDHSVYVSDNNNHRVMKWMKGAKEGIVVAGGQGRGSALTQLSCPRGVVVDQLGTVYVVDRDNNRIMRWPKGATQGSVVVGENGIGGLSNQLYCPIGLSFDRHGNLYVVDEQNHRVQKIHIDRC